MKTDRRFRTQKSAGGKPQSGNTPTFTKVKGKIPANAPQLLRYAYISCLVSLCTFISYFLFFLTSFSFFLLLFRSFFPLFFVLSLLYKCRLMSQGNKHGTLYRYRMWTELGYGFPRHPTGSES